MDNPVTGQPIKKIQPNYSNCDLLSFKLSKLIIVVLILFVLRNIQYFRIL